MYISKSRQVLIAKLSFYLVLGLAFWIRVCVTVSVSNKGL